jgi:hypothetical protein
MRRHLILLSAALGLLLPACSPDQHKGGTAMVDEALSNDLTLITQSRIFFGHQSVGNNILNGVYELASASTVRGLQIHPLSDSLDHAATFFADALIGENTKPDTKCSAFARSFSSFTHQLPEIAFMKFCFVDFGQSMPAEEIFALYASTIDSLEHRYPGVTFIHVTAPLTARSRGLKAVIKKLLGRTDNFEASNAERGRFNALMRERFASQPIFDLARLESTRPDGTRETFQLHGTVYEALVPEYTDDGGHLNQTGQERAARELIGLLASEIRARKEIVHAGLPKN